MAASGADGRIYMVGGEDSSGNLATTQVYNASIQEWTMGPPPSPRSLSSVVADAAGHIYVLGGAPWDTVGRQIAIYLTPGSGPIIGPVYSA